MEVSKFSRCRRARQAGFSMIEMLIATVILTVGLLSLAGLISRSDLDTNKSRYANTAAMLCSEKLEQLSGLRPDNPEIKVPASHIAGSLTADASTVVDGDKVAYYDTVYISVSGGSIQETTMGSDGKYMVTTQTPDGITEQKSVAVPPTVNTGTLIYKRRWIIEDGVSGLPASVRRVTVRIEYPTVGTKPGILQMSMVRNAE